MPKRHTETISLFPSRPWSGEVVRERAPARGPAGRMASSRLIPAAAYIRPLDTPARDADHDYVAHSDAGRMFRENAHIVIGTRTWDPDLERYTSR